jgi:hypothetical protein
MARAPLVLSNMSPAQVADLIAESYAIPRHLLDDLVRSFLRDRASEVAEWAEEVAEEAVRKAVPDLDDKTVGRAVAAVGMAVGISLEHASPRL